MENFTAHFLAVIYRSAFSSKYWKRLQLFIFSIFSMWNDKL